MPLQSVLALVAGRLARVLPLQVSAGSASAGALVALNAGGLVDPTMLGFLSSATSNGKWRQAPDGTVEQTGEVTLSGGTATITFPKAFPTSCDWIGLTIVTGSTSVADVSVYLTAEPGLSAATIGGSVTQLGLNASIAAASFKVRWRATGS